MTVEEEKKIRSYLGFSLRSNKIVLGTDAIEGVKKGVFLLLADEEIGATAEKRLIATSRRIGSPLYFYAGAIGELLNKPAAKAVALQDKNLATAAESVVRESEKWKLYSGGEI